MLCAAESPKTSGYAARAATISAAVAQDGTRRTRSGRSRAGVGRDRVVVALIELPH